MKLKTKLENIALSVFVSINIFTFVDIEPQISIIKGFPLFYCAIYLPIQVVYKSISKTSS